VFESRWARAYLRGPLAPRQLRDLARFAGAEPSPRDEAAAPGPEPASEGAPVPPSLDPVFRHVYLSTSGSVLSGEIAGLVETRVSRRRPPVSGARRLLVRLGSGAAPAPTVAEPESATSAPRSAPANARYGALPGWATKANAASSLERLVKDAVAAEGMMLDGIPSLGLVRAPEESADAFEKRVRSSIEMEVEKRTAKVRGPLARRLEALDRRIEEETRDLERDRAEATRSKTYSAIDVGASILTTVLGGRRSSVGSAGRAGARAYGRIKRSAEAIKESERKIADWKAERDALAGQIEKAEASEQERILAEGGRREPMRLPVSRADVRVLEWYVLWS
jgi:hypothetical protein